MLLLTLARRYFLFFLSPITIFSLDVILQLSINIMFSFYIFQDERTRRHSILEVCLSSLRTNSSLSSFTSSLSAPSCSFSQTLPPLFLLLFSCFFLPLSCPFSHLLTYFLLLPVLLLLLLLLPFFLVLHLALLCLVLLLALLVLLVLFLLLVPFLLLLHLIIIILATY